MHFFFLHKYFASIVKRTIPIRLGAMVIKKKIKRLRQNRIMELDEKLSSVDDDDDTLLQNDKETVVDERSSD